MSNLTPNASANPVIPPEFHLVRRQKPALVPTSIPVAADAANLSIARMSVDELTKTREFQFLTAKQKLFIETYLQCGLDTGTYDPVTAVRTAFNCKSYEVARVMSYRLMANISIILVLNLYFGSSPDEAFCAILERAIRKGGITPAQASILNLYAEMRFGIRPTRKFGKPSRNPKDRPRTNQEPAIDYGLETVFGGK